MAYNFFMKRIVDLIMVYNFDTELIYVRGH